MSDNILILGATSGIARALCQRLSARGCRLILAARDRAQLEPMAADLRIRHGAEALIEPFDALDFAGHGGNRGDEPAALAGQSLGRQIQH